MFSPRIAMPRQALWGLRDRIGRTLRKISAVVVVELVACQTRGRRLRHNGWSGCWWNIKGQTIDTNALTARIDDTYDAIVTQICSDWKIDKRVYKPPVLVANADSLGALLAPLGLEREVEEIADAHGAFLGGIVVALGDPNSDAFRDVLAHEMCHGVCDTALGSEFAAPWADEGYADYVELKTSPNPGERYWTLLEQFLWERDNLARTSLRDLLRTTPKDLRRWEWRRHAAMFICFLRSLGTLEPRAWDFLRGALTAGCEDVPSDEIAVRVEMGVGLKELQHRFCVFCASEAIRLGIRVSHERTIRVDGAASES